MENKRKSLRNFGAWVGVGTAIEVAVYALTSEPTWIAVGVAIGTALSWEGLTIKKGHKKNIIHFVFFVNYFAVF